MGFRVWGFKAWPAWRDLGLKGFRVWSCGPSLGGGGGGLLESRVWRIEALLAQQALDHWFRLSVAGGLGREPKPYPKPTVGTRGP